MPVGTFRADLPELESTLSALPKLTVSLAEMRANKSESVHAFFWMLGIDDPDALDTVLVDDETVLASRRLSTTAQGYLYRIDFVGGLLGARAYDALVDASGSVLDARTTGDSWEIRAFFPTRKELSTFYDRVGAMGLDLDLVTLTAHNEDSTSGGFGLTESQYHTLIAAAELGYFSVPKEVSLIELADHLGVSDQAVSERLRRGMNSLVRNTLRTGEEELDLSPQLT